MGDSPTTALIRLWEKDQLGLETLVSAATISWWVWDAVQVIAANRISFPRPIRPVGRDAAVNMVRNIQIHGEVEILRAMGCASFRKAYAAIAHDYPMLTPGAVGQIHRKVRESA